MTLLSKVIGHKTLIDLVAKHKSGELRCPATALIAYANCWFSDVAAQI